MRIAIITGASSGMGRDFVYAIDKEKQFGLDEIWVIARRDEKLKELSEKCSTQIRPIPMDLSQPENIDKLQSLLQEENPQVRILVNAAGYGLFGTFETMGTAEQMGIVDVNARALAAMCHICLPFMQAGDQIINLGSNASWQPVPYEAVYSASKAFVLSFSRSLGRELKPRRIQVLCVCPGWIRTEFMDTAVRDDTITYYDRWYESEEVVAQAMKDLKKGKTISILGLPVRNQVRLVKFLPVKLVMDTWCRQQKKP